MPYRVARGDWPAVAASGPLDRTHALAGRARVVGQWVAGGGRRAAGRRYAMDEAPGVDAAPARRSSALQDAACYGTLVILPMRRNPSLFSTGLARPDLFFRHFPA